MVCSTKRAASTLAHKRWGTKSKKAKKEKGTRIKEVEKEAPGVKERRKSGKPSTHFESVVADIERRAKAEGKPKKPKKKKSASTFSKPTTSGKVNVLIPRRKK